MSTYYLQDNRTFQGNYMMWWAKGRQGYTSNIQNAHVFTAEELAEMSLRKTDVVWNCDYINSKIKHCIDCQDCNHDEMKETTALNNKVVNYFSQGWKSFNRLDVPNNDDFCEIITNSNEIIWGVWDNHHNCFTYTDVLLIKNNQYKLSDNIVGDIYIKDIKFWRKMPQLPKE